MQPVLAHARAETGRPVRISFRIAGVFLLERGPRQRAPLERQALRLPPGPQRVVGRHDVGVVGIVASHWSNVRSGRFFRASASSPSVRQGVGGSPAGDSRLSSASASASASASGTATCLLVVTPAASCATTKTCVNQWFERSDNIGFGHTQPETPVWPVSRQFSALSGLRNRLLSARASALALCQQPAKHWNSMVIQQVTMQPNPRRRSVLVVLKIGPVADGQNHNLPAPAPEALRRSPGSSARSWSVIRWSSPEIHSPIARQNSGDSGIKGGGLIPFRSLAAKVLLGRSNDLHRVRIQRRTRRLRARQHG